MRSIVGALVAAALLTVTSGVVVAAEVPYVTGGVGLDEREQLAAQEKDNNLKVVVADVSGDFLADVRVVIESARKETMIDATMKGPILLTKLPPGSYTVKATSAETTMTRTVTVGAELRTVDFRWPKTTQ